MAEPYQAHRQLLEQAKLAQALLAGTEEPRAASMLMTMKVIDEWFGRVFDAVEVRKPIVWNQFTTFSELFYAFDVQPLPPEIWTLIKLGQDMYACCESIDAAHEAGIHPELCSAHKSLLGDLILGDKIPLPSMIVSPTYPCENAKIAYQAAAELTRAPMYFLDAPYWIDDEGAMDYWVNQFKGLISFLEEHTGQKMDPDRLKEVVEESNRTVEYWVEALELRKLKPLPQPGLSTGAIMAGYSILGLPAATEAVKIVRDDVKERIAKGETAVPEEKLRVIWFYMPIIYDMAIGAWLEDEMGVVSPVSFWDYTKVEPIDTSTTESTIRGIARRALEVPMGRQGRSAIDLWIEDCLYAVREWKGDCVILAGHAGCKWLRGGYGLMRDVLRETGIPVFIFDVDIIDPRITPPEVYRGLIEDFLSTVMAH